jgi:hypothetical protein
MLPKTEGSSEDRATGIPLLIKMGRGCMGIDDVSRCGLERLRTFPSVSVEGYSYQNFISIGENVEFRQ